MPRYHVDLHNLNLPPIASLDDPNPERQDRAPPDPNALNLPPIKTPSIMVNDEGGGVYLDKDSESISAPPRDNFRDSEIGDSELTPSFSYQNAVFLEVAAAKAGIDIKEVKELEVQITENPQIQETTPDARATNEKVKNQRTEVIEREKIVSHAVPFEISTEKRVLEVLEPKISQNPEIIVLEGEKSILERPSIEKEVVLVEMPSITCQKCDSRRKTRKLSDFLAEKRDSGRFGHSKTPSEALR